MAFTNNNKKGPYKNPRRDIAKREIRRLIVDEGLTNRQISERLNNIPPDFSSLRCIDCNRPLRFKPTDKYSKSYREDAILIADLVLHIRRTRRY